eukprot:3940141-Rhodomonas_salina.1
MSRLSRFWAPHIVSISCQHPAVECWEIGDRNLKLVVLDLQLRDHFVPGFLVMALARSVSITTSDSQRLQLEDHIRQPQKPHFSVSRGSNIASLSPMPPKIEAV